MRKIVISILLFSIALLPSSAQESDIDLTLPELGSFDVSSVEGIMLEDVPILPDITDHARDIYARGIESGNHPQRFSKLGDCMTASVEYFLGTFGDGTYDLGDYDHLEPVIDYFDVPARDEGFEYNSFNNPGLATASGYNTASVLDSIWSDPAWCGANESPLTCEFRQTRPAYALIMFGTNDVQFFDADYFNYYLRSILIEVIENDSVPILYTIPTRPEFPEKTYLFNQIIVDIARDYDLPVVNLWQAIQDLPDEGVDPVEPIHLSIPEDSATGVFTEEQLQYGYTVRNLLTLQTLKLFVDEFGDAEV